MSDTTLCAAHASPMAFGSIQESVAEKIALKSVSIQGELHGLLFEHKIRQVYKNTTEETLEIVYTFPLGFDTALLGMSAIIGDKELTGQIVGKSAAVTQYTEAVDEGDSAILVEKSADGLYTANLGNIKAGEKVIVDLRCAKLLSFEGNRVRLAIPTVISKRYGEEHKQGHLAHHESAAVDGLVKYNFSLSLNLYGEIAKARVSCPSHSIQSRPIDGGICLALDEKAKLDRDFVLLLDDIPNNSLAQYVCQDGETLVAASYAPELPDEDFAPIALKILVDCSGSMGGERIAQAILGLNKVLPELTNRDFVSYSRFGSRVVRKTQELLPCTEENLGKLAYWIDNTYADLGGTELENALRDTLKLGEENELPGMILLITDGDVWEVQEVIAAAQKFKQRIFVIGVGTSSSEHLLRNLGEKTGGACELVTLDEDISASVVRMFRRMRSVIARNIAIDWHGETIWQSRTPNFLYNGETVHCFALMATPPDKAPVLNFDTEYCRHSVQAEVLAETDLKDLFRVGMKRRMDEETNKKEQKNLALKYQLISAKTSFILTYKRADQDKVVDTPTVQKVPQMPTHGNGVHRMGSFLGAEPYRCLGPTTIPFPQLWKEILYSKNFSVFQEDRPKYTHLDDKAKININLSSMMDIWQDNIDIWQDYVDKLPSIILILEFIRSNNQFAALNLLVCNVARDLNLSPDILWGLLLQYILEQENLLDTLSKRLLDSIVNNVDHDVKANAYAQFAEIIYFTK